MFFQQLTFRILARGVKRRGGVSVFLALYCGSGVAWEGNMVPVGEFALGRASCRNTNTVGTVPSRVAGHNFGGMFVTASPSLIGFNITRGIASILSGANVRCNVCSSVGTGPAVRGMRGNMGTFGRVNTSYVITVNNNSTVSATGTVNVVVAGPRCTSIHSLRNITPAGGGYIPAVTITAATNATTRIAVGCMVASIRGGHGFIYISAGSVPVITVISPSVVTSVPTNLATSANVSTLARTVRNCVALKT